MTRMMVPWDVRSPRFYEDFRREMNQLMNSFLGGQEATEQPVGFIPRANVAETEDRYEVTLEVPGMKPEDIAVELKEGQLWVSGERKREEQAKGKAYRRIERQYGQFQRVIPLEGPTEADKVEATYKDGILSVTVPKSEKAKPKRVEVKA